jgi:2',3'-cyclic-nucleotide 2'-phosphodiesterase (5'-nucleotidase family)
MRRALSIAALWAAASGCVAFNDQCKPLVDNPDEKIARLGETVYMDRPNTRHANNAFGQVFSEAFVDVFANTSAPADFGILNGGSLRAEGVCVTRNIITKDTDITRGLVSEILLFSNLIQAADLTEPEILAMFEHSAERLFATGTTISSPAGSFLQVSKQVTMTIDCSRPAQDRVTALTIGGTAITKPGNPNKRYRAAMPSFVLAGNDGYTMLTNVGDDPDRRPAQAQKLGGVDSAIASDYLKRNFASPATITTDKSRVNFVNCAVPVPPSN